MIILADEPLKRVLGGTDEVHGFKIAKHIGCAPFSPCLFPAATLSAR